MLSIVVSLKVLRWWVKATAVCEGKEEAKLVKAASPRLLLQDLALQVFI